MDERIGRLLAGSEVEHGGRRKAMGVTLDFLVREGQSDKRRPGLGKARSSRNLDAESARADPRGRWRFDGVTRVDNRLMTARPSMGRVQRDGRDVIARV